MEYSNIKCLILVSIIPFLSGCFGPINDSEHIINRPHILYTDKSHSTVTISYYWENDFTKKSQSIDKDKLDVVALAECKHIGFLSATYLVRTEQYHCDRATCSIIAKYQCSLK